MELKQNTHPYNGTFMITAFSLFNFMLTNAHKDLFVSSYKFSFINMIMSASNPKEGGDGSTL